MSFNQDFNEDMQQARGPRRETLLDTIERALYLKMTAKERHLEILKKSDLLTYFVHLAEKYPEGKKCLVKIEKKDYRWEVMQVLLDEQENPVMVTTKAYVGRVIIADSLDITMSDIMNDPTKDSVCKILSLKEMR